MKIVIASDSFKGSLSSTEVASAAAEGIRSVFPDCTIIGIGVADGGEGTVDAVTKALGGRIVDVQVHGPLMEPVTASYGICRDTAVMEMASASGLTLIPPERRNPLLTTTFGTGEMILDALGKGCRKFFIGIGGSATNDGGTGMLTALGYRFLDASGNQLEGCGKDLERIASFDGSSAAESLGEASFTVACDVDSPFCGPSGAAFVFAPQKGADDLMVTRLDRGLENLARVILAQTGLDIRDVEGAGAAGGLGGAFMAFLGARLEKGIDMVLDAIGFNDIIRDADLVITGEGRMDSQTPKGKTPAGILGRCLCAGVPAAAIAGSVVRCPELDSMGFVSITAACEGLPLEIAMRPEIATARITAAARQLCIMAGNSTS